jgi:SOS-response transcriptional repressor LexA
MKALALTPQQERVRYFILEYQRDHGRRPTYEQIGAALGMSSLSTVARHVSGLQKKGALTLLYLSPATSVISVLSCGKH